jgi:hypothetical protein
LSNLAEPNRTISAGMTSLAKETAMTRAYLTAIASLLLLAPATLAQEKPAESQPVEAKPAETTPAETKPAEFGQAKLFKQFAEQLSDVKLIGHFTMFGKEDEAPKKEEYTISSVTKLDDGDYWLFKTRVKYGDKDITLPMPLLVKWAGDTPVITLTDTTIPGLGTFSARVVIYRDTYAGWWQHGKVGGHLFGRVEKNKPAEEK